MKLTRIACLTGLVALSAWSVAACSDDTTAGTSPEAGDETGGSAGDGGKGTGGASGSAGKGSGGTAGKGSGGSAGKAGAAGSGDGGPPISTDGGDPSIKITDPKDKETISKDAEYTAFPKIPVTFAVANFVLKAPASANCPAGACGHIHINVDGNDCNASGAPYNAAATTTTGEIDLGLCKAGVAGAHTITASLHNNDHTNVSLTDGGDAISDSITITAVVGDGGTSPDAGDGG